MKYQKVQIFNKGVVLEHKIPADIVDQALTKFTRQGYTCWKVNKIEEN